MRRGTRTALRAARRRGDQRPLPPLLTRPRDRSPLRGESGFRTPRGERKSPPRPGRRSRRRPPLRGTGTLVGCLGGGGLGRDTHSLLRSGAARDLTRRLGPTAARGSGSPPRGGAAGAVHGRGRARPPAPRAVPVPGSFLG